MLHSVFDKITFIMISRSGCIVFSVPVLPVGSKLKIGQTFSNSFLRKIFSFKPLVQNLEKSHTNDTQSTATHHTLTQNLPKKGKYVLIVCFIGVCFLLSGTTEINIFWHWFCALCTLWSGFFCAPTIFAAKGNKATKFWQNLPCFLSKKTQKTTENYGQPKPPIISSQKIDVFKGYSIG